MWLVYALPLLLLVAAVVLGLLTHHRQHTAAEGPVTLAPVDAPQAGSASCAQLLAKLPGTLDADSGPLRRAVLATPAPPGAAAWINAAWTNGANIPAEPVVLRCGLPKPPELRPTSELIAIDQVGWLVRSEPDRDTFITADRPVYLTLTVPFGQGTGPVQAVSEAIAATLPRTTG
jgi:Protein of unknown function (DUF3515)